MTCFPLLGVGDFIDNPRPFAAPHSKSEFIPDYIINPHPRFAALTTNIRSRRGSKVDIQVPLFKDANTPEFAQAAGTSGEKGPVDLPEGYKLEPDTNIHMDAMGFGMGMCCLVRTILPPISAHTVARFGLMSNSSLFRVVCLVCSK
jgi:glutamate--cysteine ligase catalytic subunit